MEFSEDVDDELLLDLDNDVDTLTLTLGPSSLLSSSSSSLMSSATDSSLFGGDSFCLFRENGPKGILTNGVVVDSLAVDGLGVFLDVGLN